MTRVLVAYASKHGSTEEVAHVIGSFLRDAGHDVDVRDVEAVTDVMSYDAVVLGASLYMGRVHAGARTFLSRYRAVLEERPLAVFALGPLKLEEEQVAGSRKQLDNALEHLGVDPQLVTVFGGVIDPKQLHFPFSRMPKTDARDWSEIGAWAGNVALRFSDHTHAETV